MIPNGPFEWTNDKYYKKKLTKLQYWFSWINRDVELYI